MGPMMPRFPRINACRFIDGNTQRDSLLSSLFLLVWLIFFFFSKFSRSLNLLRPNFRTVRVARLITALGYYNTKFAGSIPTRVRLGDLKADEICCKKKKKVLILHDLHRTLFFNHHNNSFWIRIISNETFDAHKCTRHRFFFLSFYDNSVTIVKREKKKKKIQTLQFVKWFTIYRLLHRNSSF